MSDDVLLAAASAAPRAPRERLAGRSAARDLRRVPSLDVIRGLAILGTLASNIWIFTSIGSHDGALGRGLSGGGLTFDRVVHALTGTLVDGRFLALLSIVFGIGMAILFETAGRREQRWPLRYWWRCLILLLDGLIHYLLVVEFDVLMGYAVISAVVAPVLLLSRRWIVVVAVVAGLVHLGAETYRVVGFSRLAADVEGGPERLLDDPRVEQFLAVMNGGSYLAQVEQRVDVFWEARMEAFIIMPPLTATLMLVGVLLWRAGIFDDTERAHLLQRRSAVWGLGMGLPLALAPLALETVLDPFDPALMALSSLGRYTVAPVMALGYLGLALILLRGRMSSGWLARRVAEIGRTALSCYMLQNVIASVAFYNWGLGLGPLGVAGSLVALVVISCLLGLLAHLWLRRFASGPFEAVWRYLVERPFRAADRAKAPAAAAAPVGAGVSALLTRMDARPHTPSAHEVEALDV
jgi:uncharacterized protein